jgi:voltage-gated potassium channel
VLLFRQHPTRRHATAGLPTGILRRLTLQLLFAGALLVGCGIVYWWIEPRTPSLVDGLWLAFVTASTIGYGDLVPTTPLSRLFSVLVVLIGFGVLSMVTAAIAATWVESQERRIEREILHDLHRQLKGVRDEIAALREQMGAGRVRLDGAKSEREPM